MQAIESNDSINSFFACLPVLSEPDSFWYDAVAAVHNIITPSPLSSSWKLSIIANMIAYTRRVSCILETCLNNCSFLFVMVSTTVNYHLYTETLAHSTLQLSYQSMQ